MCSTQPCPLVCHSALHGMHMSAIFCPVSGPACVPVLRCLACRASGHTHTQPHTATHSHQHTHTHQAHMNALKRSIQTWNAQVQTFSSMHGGQRRGMAATAQRALDVLSGHDVPALLTHLLTRPSNVACLRACIEHLQLPVIDAVRQAAARAPDHLKPTYLSLLAPSLSNAQLAALSVHASPRSLAHARSHSHQHGAGAMPPKPMQPASQQPIPAPVQTELRHFLLAHSQPAANRTGKEQCGKEQPAVPIHQLEASVAELHRVWQGEEGRRRMVYSTFRREVRRLRVFKHARKQTDMCEVCVSGQRQSSRLMRAMEQHQQECEQAAAVREQLAVSSSADVAALLDVGVHACDCVSSESQSRVCSRM